METEILSRDELASEYGYERRKDALRHKLEIAFMSILGPIYDSVRETLDTWDLPHDDKA